MSFLEVSFMANPGLPDERKRSTTSDLGLEPCTVAVWFQNRRVRSQNKKIEDKYSDLKIKYDYILHEKAHLESENFRLQTELTRHADP
ncbi:homeobox-leucine zipper protein ATHB-40 [Tanacetum coccineum]